MNDQTGHPGFEGDPELPAGMLEDLETLYGTGAQGVPRRVDDAVLAAARERFAAMDLGERRRAGFGVVVRRIGLVGGPLAAAAVLALVVWMTPWRPGVPQGPTPMPGMGRQQAQQMLSKEVDKKMLGDRLAFEEAEAQEKLALADQDQPSTLQGFARNDAARSASAPLAAKAERSAAPMAQSLADAATAPRWNEDFNGDGVVDMRDALMMARAVARGEWTMDANWDLNGDGVIDENDVRVVALAAVDLERHGEVVR